MDVGDYALGLVVARAGDPIRQTWRTRMLHAARARTPSIPGSRRPDEGNGISPDPPD
jgi:hypothetical protein